MILRTGMKLERRVEPIGDTPFGRRYIARKWREQHAADFDEWRKKTRQLEAMQDARQTDV